ncbi:MAG: TIGR02594 family protein [Hyphomicrobium sp.]|nr:TIGR02594 family protein [Hyphomicrobium sp.]
MTLHDQPPWLAAAWRELGQTEIAGKGDNARIVGYFRDAGHSTIVDDETAWCAAFAGAMLERSGYRSTRSLRARSYLAWGDALDVPRTGCVAVLSRGSNVALGHVGFVVGETGSGLVLLGGNQRNAVTVQVFARSRLLGFRWPGEKVSDDAPPVAAAVRDDNRFDAALTHVLKMEGGYTDDPYDPGGPTNYGITLRTYASHIGRTVDASSRSSLIAGLRSIDPETVRAIYQKRYWLPSSSAELPAGLDLFHFDAAVNHGVSGATRFLQEALNVDADGEIGPITRRAFRSARVDAVINRYAAIRERRYRALPHFWRFGRGWLNRVAATKAAAFAQLAADPVPRALNSQPEPQLANEGVASMTDTVTSTKWWGHSLTVWGAFVTAAAAILPTLGPLVGLDITSDAVRQIGSDAAAIVQAIAAFVGTLMTIYGRARATAPLVRREMNVKL